MSMTCLKDLTSDLHQLVAGDACALQYTQQGDPLISVTFAEGEFTFHGHYRDDNVQKLGASRSRDVVAMMLPGLLLSFCTARYRTVDAKRVLVTKDTALEPVAA